MRVRVRVRVRVRANWYDPACAGMKGYERASEGTAFHEPACQACSDKESERAKLDACECAAVALPP